MTTLRFFAAFFVVFYHYGRPMLVGFPTVIERIASVGYTAVSLFFLLSGFVLSYRYQGRDGAFQGSRRFFWMARLARIYPAYLTGLLLAAPFVIAASLRVNTPVKAAEKLGLNGVLALLLQQSWTPWTAWYWNTPGWSLSTEVFFYLCFPLLAPLAGRLGRTRIFTAMLFLWLAGLAAPALLSATHAIAPQPPFWPGQLAIEVIPVFRLPEFLLGVLLGRLYVLEGARRQSGGWFALLGAAGLLLALAASPMIPRPLLSNGILAPITGLLLYGLALGGGRFGAILSHSYLVALGEASYSVYILQWPLAHAFGIPSGTSSPRIFAVYAAALIGLSFLCLHRIEMPGRRMILRRLGGPRPEGASATTASGHPMHAADAKQRVDSPLAHTTEPNVVSECAPLIKTVQLMLSRVLADHLIKVIKEHGEGFRSSPPDGGPQLPRSGPPAVEFDPAVQGGNIVETAPGRTAATFLLAGLAGLLAICCVCSSLHWLKLESLWGDSTRWMFEAYRAASGEQPYRDFSWQYPPLSLMLMSNWFQVFGSSFASAQLLLDLLSAAVVLLTWRFARQLLDKPVAMASAFALACAGAGNTGNFALFSLQLYTPAILTGMAGLLLLLIAGAEYFKRGKLSVHGYVTAAIAAGIGLLSKPEFMAGVLGCLIGWAFIDRSMWFRSRPAGTWIRFYLRLFGICLTPALVSYAIVGYRAGYSNLMAGMGGYGIAFLVCPWWPTGLGILGAVVALTQAALILALLSLRRFSALRRRYRTRYISLLIMGVACIPVSMWYLSISFGEFPIFQRGVSAARITGFFLSTGSVLLPVMWFSIVFWAVFAVRTMFVRARVPPKFGLVFIAVTAALAMSARTLFGGTMTHVTTVTVAAYPIWFVVAAFLLLLVLRHPRAGPVRARYAAVTAAVVLTSYGALRLSASLYSELRTPYVSLSTKAGTVRLQEREIGPSIYKYVLDHTTEPDTILDVTGGGVNFAAHAGSPVYSTQFSALAPPRRYMIEDVERIRRRPPKLVVANGRPNFGATYGMCVDTGCPFPSLVWKPVKQACDPTVSFPVIQWIVAKYQPLLTQGDKVVYGLRPELAGINQ